MKRLEEIKNEIAIKYHYGYWVDLVSQNDVFTIDKYHNEVIHQYAREVAKASLEKAAENVALFNEFSEFEFKHWIDKKSITNPNNITLL
ncbi:hypothetical protein DSC47_10120 [Elizabethkingia miricola]|uniref:hypothetical protein n=1 Tax=Elizabethkingia bruuniana TaxID=1756149 RepID=UPI00099994C7|nr:hypothetical protein [Elizabethkingia bruuniana]OPC66356.1 hypothetical protein BAY13_16595 [Elizabethkingia bruuniana]RBI91646.1 hypothetical protein DSC47_10120 [Elizabethkingia miricola]